jgi:Raf kinase inhibitor-like YbhB/YbcL family protein
MRKATLLVILLAVVPPASAQPAAMQLTSQDVSPGGRIAQAQVNGDCNGDNVSPGLSWSGAPKETKSFAVTLYDPDARFWHWIVFAVPAKDHALAQGAGNPVRTLLEAPAEQGTNDFGPVGYGGPCPPAGDAPHHYRFTIWALDSAAPPFDSSITGDRIAPWLKSHALAEATLEAIYGR